MQIQIKQALLEGHQLEQIITEAKHAGTVYEKGTPLGILNRPTINKSIRNDRGLRDSANQKTGMFTGNINLADLPKYGNFHDNRARIKSQTSNPEAKIAGSEVLNSASHQQPRLYQAAKQ